MLIEKYPAKILLFGEYTVLSGGEALAIPYPRYQGYWARDIGLANDFSTLTTYLEHNNHRLVAKLNLPALRQMLESDYIFKSDIPQGIGLGSSGALSASLYDKFGEHKFLSLEEKKHDLAIIESFYHGKSSGFDALISLQKKAISLSPTGLKEYDKLSAPSGHVYLIFTDIRRHTQGLISAFNAASQLPSFDIGIALLASKSQACIQNFLDASDIFEILSEISTLQYKLLDFLIIPELKDLWQRGITEKSYFLKICGAGGGGAYLLFSREKMARGDLGKFMLEEIDLSRLLYNRPE